MVLGGAHFKPYYISIKYKIINNNPYNLILICVVYSIKDQKQYESLYRTLKTI